MRYTIAAAALLLAALTGSHARERSSPAEATMDDLAWLAGSWHGQGLGGTIEEHWITTSGGTMLGMFRLVAGDKPPVIEYLMITQEDDRIVYRFKHFRTDYTTWEEDDPLEFTLIDLSESETVFHSEVPDQHFPRRLTYRLLSEGNLSITVSGSDEAGQLSEGFELRFIRR